MCSSDLFILKGFTRLLNNPLAQTYLPGSTKKIQFHQELLILFWKLADYNKKFLYFLLKSADVLEILVPILYHLNDSRADQSRVGLMHIGVFILLLLSGERNFGVRLNKPYTATALPPMDIPVFSGTHADLLIIVFHKIITTGHQRLQPLFDCLLTILVNVSPYLKTLSMVASTKLLHFLEAFSTPWFLFSGPSNHHLVFFLLEIFNNIVQYQFDGNSNLVYTIIRKRQVFHGLANLPTDPCSINKSLAAKKSPSRLVKRPSTEKAPKERIERKNSASSNASATTSSAAVAAAQPQPPDTPTTPSMEGSRPALPAEPGTLEVSLASMPGIDKITERESAHPSQQQLNQLTAGVASMGMGLGGLGLDDQAQLPSSLLNASPTGATAAANPQQQTREHAEGEENENEDEDDPPLSLEQSPASGSGAKPRLPRSQSFPAPGGGSIIGAGAGKRNPTVQSAGRSFSVLSGGDAAGGGGTKWKPTSEWVQSWKSKLPLQTLMRLLQVLVPQVEKICIDKGLTDESEILKFLQHGTLVGLLPVPHPILIRKY